MLVQSLLQHDCNRKEPFYAKRYGFAKSYSIPGELSCVEYRNDVVFDIVQDQIPFWFGRFV